MELIKSVDYSIGTKTFFCSTKRPSLQSLVKDVLVRECSMVEGFGKKKCSGLV